MNDQSKHPDDMSPAEYRQLILSWHDKADMYDDILEALPIDSPARFPETGVSVLDEVKDLLRKAAERDVLAGQVVLMRERSELLDWAALQSDLHGVRTERRTYHLTVGCSPPKYYEAETLEDALRQAIAAQHQKANT